MYTYITICDKISIICIHSLPHRRYMNIKKILISILICLSFIISFTPQNTIKANSSSGISLLLLSDYQKSMNIEEQFYLVALSNNTKKPTYKSSDSTIASVNKYGLITAKKAGKVQITVKVGDSYASCSVTVQPTKITIHNKDLSLERGEKVKLRATTSNNSAVSWKSGKPSIAQIDEYGNLIAKKPGETMIIASANGTKETINITVRKPKISLNVTKVELYRGESVKLVPSISSIATPTYKSNKKSIATVSETGVITAVKNGEAIVTVKADGTEVVCEVIVKSPEIKLIKEELTLKVNGTYQMKAEVSSKNKVTWLTSNQNILNIDVNGKVTALKKGKAYIYASEDGTKVKCSVTVTE